MYTQSVTVVTSYIHLCECVLIPTKAVKCYPNNRPWFTAHLKRTIQAKHRAFAMRHGTEKTACQIILNRKIILAKGCCKGWVEADKLTI